LFCLLFVVFFLVDYKKLIAFWSLLHTGLCLVLLWHNDILFIFLCFYCNFAHLFSSLFMFLLLGLIYDMFGLRVFFLLYSFFGYTMFAFLFIFCVLFNIDFPFMLMFYFDLIFIFGIMCCSFWYFFCFFFSVISLFISSLYLYVCLNFFSFVFSNFYLRLDCTLNFVFVFYILFMFVLFLFFFWYF